jgi:ferredoxin
VRVEPDRCVECGVCSYGCPVRIDVRALARAGAAVLDGRCELCGDCVVSCPHGALAIGPPPEDGP